MATDAAYVSASIGAVTDEIGLSHADVRLAFEPFGRQRAGRPDPEAPDYRLLGAEAYSYWELIDRPTVFLEGVDGRRYVLADGSKFKYDGTDDLEGFPEVATLADCGHVLGVAAADGGGYVPVGVNVVLLLPA